MKRLASIALAVAGATLSCACAAELSLRISEPIEWRGVAAGSTEGSKAAFLYPAPNPLAGLVAVLTHGAMVSGAHAVEDKRLREEGDRVLQPFQPALRDWSPKSLADAALERLAASSAAAPSTAWVIEVRPAFSLFPDSRRLALDAAMLVIDPTGAATPKELQIRVLSNPRTEAFPSDDNASQLKAEGVRLMAHAAAIALQRVVAADEGEPARTHRYLDGEREAMERAQLVGRGCARLVLRTLRGGLLSVPVAGELAGPCVEDPYRFPAS